jgi:adenylosuccinate lyase
MVEDIARTLGLIFSQPVLLALVASGLSRDDAYRIVQRCAHTAWDTRTPFLKVLLDDREVPLSEADLLAAMDLDAALKNVRYTFEALLSDVAMPKEKKLQLRSMLG